jgi:hypothetical protein
VCHAHRRAKMISSRETQITIQGNFNGTFNPLRLFIESTRRPRDRVPWYRFFFTSEGYPPFHLSTVLGYTGYCTLLFTVLKKGSPPESSPPFSSKNTPKKLLPPPACTIASEQDKRQPRRPPPKSWKSLPPRLLTTSSTPPSWPTTVPASHT